MHAGELKRLFRRIYPECSRLDIENLVSAMLSGKYWRVHPSKDDAYYVVALTRAKIPFRDGFRAKSTAPWPLTISPRAARFCRRGRILVIKKGDYGFISETVIDWPVFLRLMKMDENLAYKCLIKNPNPPPFLNARIFRALLSRLRSNREEET
ncbi:hypothetical protein KEJ14_03925 [Candidatus Bathyarchaeota archaeon]|nr:hypothetical protein [Candidatus Bathyarchaeota archaeon]